MDGDSAIGAVDPVEPLAGRAYDMLRDAILSNRLLPGKRLSVSDLARQMNISRTPVREAVQRLIYDGLAVHVPYRGADVVRVGMNDLRQLFDVREVLDGLAARLACRRIEPEDLEELRGILREHELLLTREAVPKGHIELDIRYHGRIRALSGNADLAEMLGRIQGKSHLAMHSLWRGEGDRRRALSEHWQIFEALSGRDPEAADRAARHHVVRIQARLPRALSGPGWNGGPAPAPTPAQARGGTTESSGGRGS